MSRVAGMRWGALLFRKVATSQAYAWTPVQRASDDRRRGAGFTSSGVGLSCAVGFMGSVLFAAAASVADGRTLGRFAVSSAGEAQYSIPIFAPPGINGLAPQLALTYSHRHEGTLAGVGWGISGLSAIHRCEKTWAQNNEAKAPQNAIDDRYCLDGNQLRHYSGAYGQPGSTYRTEIETYARITALGPAAGNGPGAFRVEHKNGLISDYGATADSQILSIGQPEVRAWALNKISDRSGNEITFTWHDDTANGSYRIDYIGYAGTTIDFQWEAKPAGEVRSGYVIGSPVREIHRLQAIEVHQSGLVLRRYELSYEGPLSTTSRSRLASIRECAGAVCRDATTFDYQDGTVGLQGEVNTTFAVPAGELPLDVNGDGRGDLVYVSSTTSGAGHWMVMLASSSGGYSSPIDSLQSNVNYADAIPFDYDHDGMGDVLVPGTGAGPVWRVMLGSANGLGTLTNTDAPATATGRGGNARGLDINGDGWEDLVWADLVGFQPQGNGDAIRYRLRTATGFESSSTNLIGPSPAQTALVSPVFGGVFAWQRPAAPDFNGDGRGDVAYRLEQRFRNAELGKWDFIRTVNAICAGGGCNFAQNLPGGAGPLSYGDFNGDGLSDLFYYSGQVASVPNSSTWWYALSRGTSFANPIQHHNLNGYSLHWMILDWDTDGYDDVLAGYGVPTSGEWRLFRATGLGLASQVSVDLSTPNASQVLVSDLNGDGLHDVAYSLGNTWRYRTHAGVTPDLLTHITDGHGNTVAVSYAPLTASGVHTKTTGAVFPEQEWQDPMTVVTEHTASDGIGGTYSVDHTYEGARRHRQGRGFEGFYRHTALDDRNGTKTHEYFARLFPHTGSPEFTELRQSNNTLIESADPVLSAATPTGGIESRTLPFASTITTKTYGVGPLFNGTLLSTVVTATAVDAATGTPTGVTDTTTEAGGANGLYGGRTWTERTVHSQLLTSTSGADWCVGRPQRTQQINSHSSLPDGAEQTRTLATTWDATHCRPTQQVLEPELSQWRLLTDLAYDSFGNLQTRAIRNTQSAQRTWRVNWGADGRFPTETTNPLNQTTRRTFDARFGSTATETDPNGLATTWVYDSFGRRSGEIRPDQTRTDWTYAECANSCGQNRLIVTATLKGATGGTIRNENVYLDTFDRPILSRTQLLGGGYGRIERQYDDLGRLARESAPCTETACPSPLYWTDLDYDLVGRPTQVSRPFTSTSTQTTRIAYAGLTTTVTDPLGKLSVRIEDVRGRLVRAAGDDGYAQTFAFDAFGNPLRVTDSAGKTLQSATFNVRGLRTSATDADLGTWQYAYNAFGEPTSHTDANGRTTSYTWDALGRPLTRVMPEGTGTITRSWIWGTSSAAKDIGRLKESKVEGTGVSTYREVHAYDSKGRPLQTEYHKGTSAPTSLGFVNVAYDTTSGLIDSLTYPESTAQYRLKLKYEYDKGLLKRVKDFNAPATVFWEATTMDAYGLILDETLGNGLKTIRGVDPRTGLLESITSGPTSALDARQNFEYVWDRAGNVTSRTDHNQSLTEVLEYDDLHRLTRMTLNGVERLALTYDVNGNVLSKSAVGSYAYDPLKLHAVTSITLSGSAPQTFTYDANGNMTNRNGTELLWFADNRVKRIRKTPTSASNSSEFQYGPDGQRWYHKYNAGGTIYTHVNLGGLLEIVTKGAIDDFRHTIHANGVPVALYSRKSTGTNTLRYLLRDHQGSLDVITTSTGAVELKTTFGPFGQRLNATRNGPVPSGDVTALREISRRGYTDHEHLDSTALIHMNGRVYDPLISRFVSADPFIDGITNTQGWNRYSYVGNNPLSYTDPSGYLGVPQGPDAPPETPPGGGGFNSNLCLGAGFYQRCFAGIEGPHRDLHFSNELSEGQIEGMALRRIRTNAGTANFMPHLGEAQRQEDFGNTVDRAGGMSLRQASMLGASMASGFLPGLGEALDAVVLVDPTSSLLERMVASGSLTANLATGGLLPNAGGVILATRGTTTVIGKLGDLKNLAIGERSLLDRLPNLRSPRANWAQNSGVLRQEMLRRAPIRDASVDNTGALINNSGFLRAERNLLHSHGWTYDRRTTMWYPPEP